MKAIVWTRYGSPDVLQLQEVAKPIPKDNEILIKVCATGVTAGDCEFRQLKFPLFLRIPIRLFAGLRKPTRITVLGQELSGEVEAVGKAVTRFKQGDRVFGTTGFKFGGYAEYVCLPEQSDMGALAIKPPSMTYEQAATTPTAGIEALHFMRKAAIQPGHKLLIVGAGGSIGTFAVQLAKHFGADVTAVDKAGKLDMLRSIGADRVMDYAKDDYTQQPASYNAIFDVMGKSSFSPCIKALKPNGRYLLGNFSLSQVIRGLLTSMTSGKKVVIGAANQKTDDLIFLTNLIEAGKLTSVIDRGYPLAHAADAHRYVESGDKKGNVYLNVS